MGGNRETGDYDTCADGSHMKSAEARLCDPWVALVKGCFILVRV